MNTAIVGRLNGIITYDDGSVANFYSEVRYDGTTETSIGTDAAQAETYIGDVKGAKPTAISSLMAAIPGVSSIIWTPPAAGTKTVTDVVLHLSAIATAADGTSWSLSLTFEKNSLRQHVRSANSIDATFLNKLLDVFTSLSNSEAVANDARPIKVNDDINDGAERRVLIYVLNAETDDDAEILAWKQLNISGNFRRFDHLASIVLTGVLGRMDLTPITVTTGRKYAPSGRGFADVGASSDPTVFEVTNTSEKRLTIETTKDGDAIQRSVLEPGTSRAYKYRPTIWIYQIPAADDVPAYTAVKSQINTEISLFGVGGATVDVRKSGDVYTFTLSNITFA